MPHRIIRGFSEKNACDMLGTVLAGVMGMCVGVACFCPAQRQSSRRRSRNKIWVFVWRHHGRDKALGRQNRFIPASMCFIQCFLSPYGVPAGTGQTSPLPRGDDCPRGEPENTQGDKQQHRGDFRQPADVVRSELG